VENRKDKSELTSAPITKTAFAGLALMHSSRLSFSIDIKQTLLNVKSIEVNIFINKSWLSPGSQK
ncbi:uncharacterized protein METZ01_LOCUS338037, partial [marine metagenome]